MADNVSKKVRSSVMRAIPSRGTRPEVLMRLGLVRSKFKGWRMHSAQLPGKPDFVFPIKKVAIFVDGCFWHGCKECYRGPKSSKRYWSSKLRLNMDRDAKVRKALMSKGWRILRFWEHQVRNNIDMCLSKVRILCKS